MSDYASQAANTLSLIKERNPLVHNITNFVVMNFTANALLAMGASPVMAHAREEAEQMAAFASALVLNIGTLTTPWIDAMILAGRSANKHKAPVILDPVGCGATDFRTDSVKRILEEVRVTIVRGNASEILSLASSESKTKGVDSVHSVNEAEQAARELAGEMGTTLAITGPVDFITDGKTSLRVANGHPLLPSVTGTGCSATATIGAFAAIDPNPVSAAACALSFFGLAAEHAAATAKAPGSFMIALQDALYTMTGDDLKKGCRIETA